MSSSTTNATLLVSDGTVNCTGTVAAGTCTLTPTTAGAKTLTATYAGDANLNGSNDTEPHQVSRPVPVGGVLVPVSRVELLAPWLGLAAALVLSTAAVILRRHGA